MIRNDFFMRSEEKVAKLPQKLFENSCKNEEISREALTRYNNWMFASKKRVCLASLVRKSIVTNLI